MPYRRRARRAGRQIRVDMAEKCSRPLEITFLEPFDGGSHGAFARGWAAASVHRIEVVGLPPRFWKWRMRGGALELYKRVAERGARPDLWVATSLMDVAHFKALAAMDGRFAGVPLMLYFHECQAAYPQKDGAPISERDYHFLVTDLVSAASAERCVFNTRYLMDEFFEKTAAFLRRMPDTRPEWLLERVRERACVLSLALDLDWIRPEKRPARRGVPLSILWPHRWEHDKNPEEFFEVLSRLEQRGLDYRLLVAGGRYERVPEVFEWARERLAHRIDHWGEVKGREEYARLLSRADIVVSTALHETFGMAMVEAAYAGAHPLAPTRLSYPEVIPGSLAGRCLYDGAHELEERLASLLAGEEAALSPGVLAGEFARYGWAHGRAGFDEMANQVSQCGNLCYAFTPEKGLNGR